MWPLRGPFLRHFPLTGLSTALTWPGLSPAGSGLRLPDTHPAHLIPDRGALTPPHDGPRHAVPGRFSASPTPLSDPEGWCCLDSRFCSGSSSFM